MTVTANSKERDVEIASTILGQIPLGVKMSLGIRDKIALEGGGLRIRVGPGNPARWIVIRLTGRDTYDVACFRVKRQSLATATEARYEDVYAEDLGRILSTIEREVWG